MKIVNLKMKPIDWNTEQILVNIKTGKRHVLLACKKQNDYHFTGLELEWGRMNYPMNKNNYKPLRPEILSFETELENGECLNADRLKAELTKAIDAYYRSGFYRG